ncbi:hypothetical protein H9Y04_32605 [Streptomyces sp. TRM66268-LWL]|uniref:Gram-positive cocci surface proteins LPxTG domain-containing protein n=2 Tax=Streptomyces polyasparticus TaxID=2767826 RepID=A0ABR7SR31_9ACTN|nr:hypothetical protein [Streptomyces polyasparticus]
MAVLLAAALTTAGTAGLAQAADEAPIPVAITGTERLGLSLNGEPEEERYPQIELQLNAPGEVGEDEQPTPVHQGPYTVTIDATELKGFAKLKLPCAVQAGGLTAVCEENDLYPGGQFNPDYDIRVDLLAGAKAGDTGKIKVTGAGEGLAFTGHEVDVLVGGPEIRMKKLPAPPKGFSAGDTYAAPLAFRNVGSMSADGVLLRFSASRGMSFPETYSNCSYAEEDKDNLIRYRKVVECAFEGEFEPGKAYGTETPVKVATEKFAAYDIFGYWFSALGAKQATARVEGGTKGTGPELKLKEVPVGDAAGYGKYAGEIDLPANSKYDLDLTGSRVSGKQGETVKVPVTFANNGPAWIGSLRAGGEPFGFYVEIPKGAKVAKAPENCQEADSPAQYLCWADTPFLENTERAYAFELRIDKVIEGAKGKISLPKWEGGNPNEADPANDDGWIVLNGTGDEATPGDTGGTGTGGGDNGGSGSSGEGDNGGTDTGGSTGGAASGTDGGSEGPDDGGLASTGSVALLTSVAAAVALAAGGAFYVTARRRRTS